MLFNFGNSLGWYAFLALVPLIIIYLIRPKPTKLKVPSLMFFMSRASRSTTQSLFRYFQNDILFFIQLLVLAFLAFSIVEPLLILNKDVSSSNIVFVVDVSASSQVIEDGGATRLDIAKEKIKSLTTSKNSLVLMKSSPVIALQNAGRSEFLRYVGRLESTDDLSDVASAISLAGEMLSDSNGRIVVLSDFIESKGVNSEVSKNVLESRGVGVDFINLKGINRNNAGIVNMVINGEDVNLYIKNYNDDAKEISLKVNNEIHNLNVDAKSVEPFVFALVDNVTNVEITNKDDFIADNSVIITKPYSDVIKVLLISNRPSKFLKAALNSIEGVSLTSAEPPIIPEGDFDIYVIDNFDRSSVVVDTFGTIMRDVRDNGKSAIVAAQRDMSEADFEELLPVEFGQVISGGAAEVQHTTKFTKDIDFGSVNNMMDVFNNTEGSIVTVNNASLISMFNIGDGNVIYYGIIESESDFKLTPGYPVFWNNLIYSLVGRGDLNEVNLKTGSIFNIGNETRVLDTAGLYEFKDKSIAVNLLNDKESDINFDDTMNSAVYTGSKLQPIKNKVDYRLDFYLVVLALALIVFEFIYIKLRGEL